MIGLVKMSAAARNAIALCCLVTAGCAAVTRLPTAEPVAPAAAPVASTSVDAPPVVTPPPETVTAHAATGPALDAAPKPPPLVIATPNAPVPQAAAATAVVAPAPVTRSPPEAPLDFASLGTRLRETKTIGVLTKLAVKNEADGLLDQFRAYHTRQGAATLSELRHSYDTLVLKLISLLQDGDPPLVRDIVQSQTAIWEILADPRKFTESNLMAGATT